MKRSCIRLNSTQRLDVGISAKHRLCTLNYAQIKNRRVSIPFELKNSKQFQIQCIKDLKFLWENKTMGTEKLQIYIQLLFTFEIYYT